MDYADYPRPVVEDIVRLRRRIQRSGVPQKVTDQNLVIGTWNIRGFGRVFNGWGDSPAEPKRNLRAMACIAEIVRCYDVIAIQEVKTDTSGVRMLVDDFLGPDWGLILSDVSAGPKGNAERLSFIYDKRRVEPSGLAGEIVLPPTAGGQPGGAVRPHALHRRLPLRRRALCPAHCPYQVRQRPRRPPAGDQSPGSLHRQRDPPAGQVRRRGEQPDRPGRFQHRDRGDNPLFQAFVSTGLIVPPQLLNLRTTYDTKPKYYDQVAWFMGDLTLETSERAGVIDIAGAAFKELTLLQMSYRLSDHFPLWVEFITDRSREQMARTLGVDPAMPDPFNSVPD